MFSFTKLSPGLCIQQLLLLRSQCALVCFALNLLSGNCYMCFRWQDSAFQCASPCVGCCNSLSPKPHKDKNIIVMKMSVYNPDSSIYSTNLQTRERKSVSCSLPTNAWPDSNVNLLWWNGIQCMCMCNAFPLQELSPLRKLSQRVQRYAIHTLWNVFPVI